LQRGIQIKNLFALAKSTETRTIFPAMRYPPRTGRIPMDLIACITGWGLALFLAGCGLFRLEGDQDGTPRIEVAVFDGGFGTDWHRKTLDAFLQIRKDQGRPLLADFWGDPRILDKIRPRVLRGSPPDLSDASMPFWKLVVADILLPLDHWLDEPAVGQPDKTWRESFLPGALNLFTYEGKVYGIPLVMNSWLIYYDRKIFRDRGWSVPATFEEWEALCDSIREAGIAPMAFQGKYPQYSEGIFWNTFQRLAGIHKVERCQNFEPGAFLDPDVIRAAALIQSFASRNFQKGFLSMSHTEAQMEFCNRRAAMIPCGIWLENEMRKAFPPDFELGCFTIPRMEGGRGSGRATYAIGAQAFFVYRQGAHPEDAAELLKVMLSRENAREWVRKVATVSSISGATARGEVSTAVEDALDLIEGADYTYDDRLYDLFPTWRNEVWVPALDGLLTQRFTPEEFAHTVEDGMERVRQDPTLYKPPPRPLPQGAEVEQPL
jgi:N-acetylglucosamine transport system substrate-binding protein